MADTVGGGKAAQSTSVADSLQQALKEAFGFDSWRAGQRELIETVLARRDAFALLPTGGGKSLVYQLPALQLPGLTVVISPLIALMHDQVTRLTANGIAATSLSSALDTEERERREAGVRAGAYRLLYVAPERLVSPPFLALLHGVHQQQGISLLAVDEAHCVSEWGHDFRPEYRQIGRLRERFPDVPLLALTATATEQVRKDIVSQLRLRDPFTHVASFNRPNLVYEVRRKGRDTYYELLALLRTAQQEQPGAPAILYCQSRSAVDTLATRLADDSIRALPYHAGLSAQEREQNQDAFIRDRVPVLVATIAFGMGVAKPDVRMVIHVDAPRSLESYYQESGRAGRDGDPARCVLFFAPGDRAKVEYFIAQRPDPEQQAIARAQFQQVLTYAQGGGCRRRYLLAYFGEEYHDVPCGACDNCLQPRIREDRTADAQKLLSAVARTGQRFGLRYVIDVLRGSGAAKIVERGHDTLSVFGIGRDHSVEDWQHLGQMLLLEDLLTEVDAATPGYTIVRLTPGSWEVLRGQRQVEVAQAIAAPTAAGGRARAGDAAATLDAVAFALFEQLRALRRELAEAANVPPYVVFADASLREMALRRPVTLEQFATIPGVGSRKLEAFGRTFTGAISAYCDASGAEPWPQQAQTMSSAAPAPTRRRTPRASTSASTPDISATVATTLDLFTTGRDPEQIAAERGLSRTTVINHLCEVIAAGEPIAFERLVPPELEERIVEAFARAESLALTPIKEALGDDVRYEDLQLVRARLRALQQQATRDR